MLVRVGPRQTGRSSWAIKLAERNTHHRLMVFSQAEAKRIMSEHPHLKDRVSTWRDPSRLYGTREPLIIDNVDMLIREHFGPLNPDVVTIEGILI